MRQTHVAGEKLFVDFAGDTVPVTPIAYAARNASVPQQAGALRLPEGFAPRPVATPDLTGPSDERTLPPTG